MVAAGSDWVGWPDVHGSPKSLQLPSASGTGQRRHVGPAGAWHGSLRGWRQYNCQQFESWNAIGDVQHHRHRHDNFGFGHGNSQCGPDAGSEVVTQTGGKPATTQRSWFGTTANWVKPVRRFVLHAGLRGEPRASA